MYIYVYIRIYISVAILAQAMLAQGSSCAEPFELFPLSNLRESSKMGGHAFLVRKRSKKWQMAPHVRNFGEQKGKWGTAGGKERQLWGVLGSSGQLCGALGSSGELWRALGSSGQLWGTLGGSGQLWGALCSSG